MRWKMYPFQNVDGANVEVWEWISNFVTHYAVCDYLSMLGLKLNHVGQMGPWYDIDWIYQTVHM